jgi:Grx4 family monothiol glutaredoxin
VAFQRVEAEEVDDVVEKFGIESVPAFVFLRDGVVVDRLEGADAPSLTAKAAALASGGARSAAAPAAASAAAAPPGGADVVGRIKYILSSHPVCLFMKGVASAPRCGFSGRVVEALQGVGSPFHCIDILSDEALRTGLKEYSNWPTYPQLYVKGELVGGCDIILEMAGSGELKALIIEKLGPNFESAAAAAAPAAPAAAPAAAAAAPGAAGDNVWVEGKEHLNGRIKRLLESQPVMLFMKGDRDAPRCGFSRKVADALASNGLEFGTFDILSDESVRSGLKEYSNWPTYPQLYVKGELVGGCDIILEMNETGELKSAVEEMLSINPDK